MGFVSITPSDREPGVREPQPHRPALSFTASALSLLASASRLARVDCCWIARVILPDAEPWEVIRRGAGGDKLSDQDEGGASPRPPFSSGARIRECCRDLGLQSRDRLEDAVRPRIAQVLERLRLVLANLAHA
jgi:hypothetical protein